MKGRAFDSGAKFIRDTNPNANFNAFLAHWRKELGISQQEARDLYDEIIVEMGKLGIVVSDFNEFKEVAVNIINIPVVDPSTVDINGA